MIKFLKKGIKTDSNYYPIRYSKDNRVDNIKGITIYAKNTILGLPKELNPKNDSDIMIDYFENDKVFIPQASFCKTLKAIYIFLTEQEKLSTYK